VVERLVEREFHRCLRLLEPTVELAEQRRQHGAIRARGGGALAEALQQRSQLRVA